MLKRRLIIYLVAIAVSLSIVATAVSCTEPSLPTGEEMIEFTDALGRKVSVNKNPARVAALLGSFADVWMLSGGTLCAAAEDAWEDFGLSLGDAVNIGGAHSPSLELLILSDPDLVIASASTASNLDMKDPLEAMGITVAYFEVDNFEDYLYMIGICTDITGRKDLFEQNGLAVKKEIDAIKYRLASANLPENEKKILLLRASSTSVKAKSSRGTVLGEMLSDLGCINIADSHSGLLEDLSVEEVIKEEPYRIFVVTMGSDTEAAKASLENMIKENPAWSTLSAVKCERLYLMEKRLFNLKPNARWAESYGILYEKLTEK